MSRPAIIPPFSIQEVLEAGYPERLLVRGHPQPNGCLIWPGRTNSTGYPRVAIKIRGYEKLDFSVHRLVWSLVNGCWPEDQLHVLHATPRGCIGKGCIAPAHLRLGTRKENMHDLVLDGRAGRGPGVRTSDKAIRRIIEMKQASERTEDIAQELGCSMATVSKYWRLWRLGRLA